MEINHYANKVIKWALHFTMMSVMLFHIIKSLYCNVTKSCTFKYCITVFIKLLQCILLGLIVIILSFGMLNSAKIFLW